MDDSVGSSTTSSLFSPLIEHAIELAAQWHDKTYRKSIWRDPAFMVPEGDVLRVPIFSHVTSVAMIVQRAGWDDETIAAAFLHDVLEDSNYCHNNMSYDELSDLIGKPVADRVLMVSEKKFDASGAYRSWYERKLDYIEGLRIHSVEAVAISLADKTHNLWTMNQGLARGIDIFVKAENRKALSASVEEQIWFHRAVFEASHQHDDVRLVRLRAGLENEINRFEQLTRGRSEAPI